MSALLDSLLGATRLADCLANDAAIAAPPVEMDEAFFARVDMVPKSAIEAIKYSRALEAQINREACNDYRSN